MVEKGKRIPVIITSLRVRTPTEPSTEIPTKKQAMGIIMGHVPTLNEAVREFYQEKGHGEPPSVRVHFFGRLNEVQLRLCFGPTDPTIGDSSSAIKSRFWELVTEKRVERDRRAY